MNDGMKDANVAEALYCPVEVVASLVKDPSEVGFRCFDKLEKEEIDNIDYIQSFGA
jgi:hypothetical protein